MTQSRCSQISLEDTPYYHLISRCVRRAFLCGVDKYSQQSFEHRRQWMVERIRFLTSVFAIDVAAYAVMSNHYHLVVHVNEAQAKAWTVEEVSRRWGELYQCHPLVDRLLTHTSSCQAEVDFAIKLIEKWRLQLTDISWLMRNLNEYIARKANKEDVCKGRFWEGRFKSQALLDEKAVLACMAYVDLNPIRAKMANTPDASEFTSVFERIHGKASHEESSSNHTDENPFKTKPLLGFIGNSHKNSPCGIAFSLLDYLSLIEATGRIIREEKHGYIPANTQPLLKQLGLNGEDWLQLAQHFGKTYQQAVGSLDELALFASHTNKKWISGHRQQSVIFQ